MTISYDPLRVRDRVVVLLMEGHSPGVAFQLASQEEGERGRHGKSYAELKTDLLTAAERSEPPRAETAQKLAAAQRAGQSLPPSSHALDDASARLIGERVAALSKKRVRSTGLAVAQPSDAGVAPMSESIKAGERPAGWSWASEAGWRRDTPATADPLEAARAAAERLAGAMASQGLAVNLKANEIDRTDQLAEAAAAYQRLTLSETGRRPSYREALLAVQEAQS